MGLFSQSGGTDAGNIWQNGGTSGQVSGLDAYGLRSALAENIGRQGANTYGAATDRVQGNPMLSQLFGKGGQLDQSTKEATDLAGRGYSMQPEDYEAYGQASGNIARMTDQRESGLAQALSARGLDSSGAAAAAFAGSQGNKYEQLAGQQRQIADQRMQRNMERLNQTRQYAMGLGQQAQGAIGQSHNIEEKRLQGNYNNLTDVMGHIQGQNDEALSQRSQTAGPSTAQMISAGLGMAGQAQGLVTGIGGMSGGGGGLSGGGGALSGGATDASLSKSQLAGRQSSRGF